VGEPGKEPVEELAADVVEDGGINEEFKLRVIHTIYIIRLCGWRRG
jgi:hypothetical protein